MNKDFLDALNELERTKNIRREEILMAIETAIENAYKKEYNYDNVKAQFDRESGELEVLMSRTVVEEVEDEMLEVSLEEAKSYDPDYEVGDIIQYEIDPKEFGRIAAQNAKQIIVQRIREVDRYNQFAEFSDKKGEVITATVDRISNNTIFAKIGSNAEGLLPVSEQVKTEKFKVGDRVKVYVMDVKSSSKGPQIFLSRSHPSLVRKLFELEIPEIADGVVEIKGIAREAGSRTKIAVYSVDENVDALGSCVGNRGARVQSIVDELFGEKIDIIEWDEDPAIFIRNVLRPADVEGVYINEDAKMATAVVPEQQLSLAIGREGQNVRLAARVSGWKIDIKSKAQLEASGFNFDDFEEEETVEA